MIDYQLKKKRNQSTSAQVLLTLFGMASLRECAVHIALEVSPGVEYATIVRLVDCHFERLDINCKLALGAVRTWFEAEFPEVQRNASPNLIRTLLDPGIT